MKILDEKIEKRSLTHAILLCGDYKDYDIKIAKSFICTSENEICNSCKACLNVRSCADVEIIDFLDKQITVDVVRNITKDSKTFPLEFKNKVFIIKNAENMNLNASNALLKTLEEPPNFSKFVFTTKNPNKLLDTILSRCLIFSFNDEIGVKTSEVATKIATAIVEKNELDILSLKFVNKADFKEIIIPLKLILRDALINQGENISKKMNQVLGDRKILEIYNVVCEIEEILEFNVTTNNLLYLFVTKVF